MRHVLKEQDLIKIQQFVKSNPNEKWSLRDLHGKIPSLPNCGKTTLSVGLKRAGIKTYKCIKKRRIEPELKNIRKNYSRYYLNLLKNNPNLLNSFVFTDESTFYNNKSFSNFTRSLESGRDNVNNYSNHNDRKFKVNVYGIFSKYSLKLILVDNKLNQEEFRKLLVDKGVLNYVKSIVPDVPFLIQDNTRIHRFDLNYQNTILEECNQRGINLVEFPSYSPDLNIIENIWGFLKKKVF